MSTRIAAISDTQRMMAFLVGVCGPIAWFFVPTISETDAAWQYAAPLYAVAIASLLASVVLIVGAVTWDTCPVFVDEGSVWL